MFKYFTWTLKEKNNKNIIMYAILITFYTHVLIYYYNDI